MFHYLSSTSWPSAADLPDLGRLVAPLREAQNQLPFVINLVYDHGSGSLRFPEIPLKGFRGLALGCVKLSGEWPGSEENFDEMARIIETCDVPGLPDWIELTLSVSYEEKTGKQKPMYCDFVTITVSRTRVDFWNSINRGTDLGNSFEASIAEFARFADLCDLPVALEWADQDTVDLIGREEGVRLPANCLGRHDRFGPQLRVFGMKPGRLARIMEGTRTFVQDRAQRIFGTEWRMETIGITTQQGNREYGTPEMVEDLIRRFNRLGFGGRKLCAETSGIQFLEPAGYDLARVLLWEGETQYLPLVKFEAEKRACLLNAAVSREGARLAVSARKPLKPETLADIARRLEIPFDPDPVESR